MEHNHVNSIKDLIKIREDYEREEWRFSHQVLVCGGAGCVSSDCRAISEAAAETIEELGLAENTALKETGCMGTCAVGPVMLIMPEGIFYTKLTPQSTREIIKAHIVEGRVLEEHTFYDNVLRTHVPKMEDITFFKEQLRIALRNCGVIAYDDIRAYIAKSGYMAAAKALLEMDGSGVIAEIKKSGIRGRGGAGFPTAVKWEAGRRAQSEEKYIVCNADEGDPGAFMDRSILEGDPHTVIEGMLIGGRAIGANMGYVYVRAEYPIAVERLKAAIEQAREYGLLGKDILGSGFDFDLEIRIGAGAFVCGEETALLNSIEGKRGEPRPKPPFPFENGLFGAPTIINNVETLASIPPILLNGGDWYAGFGTEQAKGTKVFALAGDIVNTGIVEVPIGMPIGEIIFRIGGGMQNDKKFKAAQIGGPSGGCITEDNLNAPTDYESLTLLGAIMGSGGLISMNEETCMVDTARYFMEFIQEESCGKCLACRVGTKRMLEILENITQGRGEEGDIELLEELGNTIKDTAMCGLGQTAPNPVLSTIRYFRKEYEEHIRNKYCRASVCADLFISPCENTCPANVNIPGYLSLIATGRFMDAYNLIRQENPLPAICGRICTRPCEGRCRRGSVDEPVAICDLKRFVADYAFKNEPAYVHDVVFPRNGKSVAIVGAGASGLTCGYYLSRIGYEVDIYEAEAVAGGVLAFGIPEYRLPSDVLQHEVNTILKEGVHLHLNTTVGKDIEFRDVRDGHDAVYIATGTQFPQRVNIPGENLKGIIHGVTFLKNVKLYKSINLEGQTVAVIGGGNTAIDSARSALRLGAAKVIVLYRRTAEAMPAYRQEVEEALHEGVEIMELVKPVRFISDKHGSVAKVECIRCETGQFDNRGRREIKDIPNSNFFVDIDVVIPAVSQYADLPFIPRGDIGVTKWGTFIIDEDTYMTTEEGVFAGGDVARGPDEVIRAISDGKNAAISIDLYLGGEGKLNKGQEIDIPLLEDDDEIISHERFEKEILPLEERHSFEEVIRGYHKLNAIAEAMRCLHCNRR